MSLVFLLTCFCSERIGGHGKHKNHVERKVKGGFVGKSDKSVKTVYVSVVYWTFALYYSRLGPLSEHFISLSVFYSTSTVFLLIASSPVSSFLALLPFFISPLYLSLELFVFFFVCLYTLELCPLPLFPCFQSSSSTAVLFSAKAFLSIFSFPPISALWFKPQRVRFELWQGGATFAPSQGIMGVNRWL